MLVRPFHDHDVTPACRLTNYFIQNTAIHFGTQPLTDQEFAATWQAATTVGSAQGKVFPWLAAEIDGAFAGYAKAGTWRPRDAYALTAEVTVYIDPKHHRRGLGRALYTELFNRLRAAGFHTVVGGIALPNEGSIKLHQSMGFRHVGTYKQVGRKFDQWHDTDWWQLMLG